MVSAIDAAVSGLSAGEARLQVNANNTANQLSPQYAPQQVDQVSLGNGGVLAKSKNVTPAAISVPDTSNPGATAQLPDVDMAQERVNQSIATYDFKANLKTIQVAGNMQQSLLNMVT
ncbi:MAG: hypothetical protein KGJ06_01885 [Pseudomonadota bacterium]|nr:hypothetical protein [Pseudomonadota bacterium]